MPEIKTDMPRLPGFETFNAEYDRELEAQYPGLREIFDRFLSLNQAPPDLRDEIYYDQDEFPIEAAIAVPDQAGHLEVISWARNRTKSADGSLGHAELRATRGALKGGKHLPDGAILLSTVEPCSMCASGLHHANGHKVVFGLDQADLRGRSSWVDGKPKPHRAEPAGYNAKDFLLARDPQAVVQGGYRREEVLKLL